MTRRISETAADSVEAAPLTLAQAAAALRAGTTTSVELTTRAQARADRVDSDLGVYLNRFDEYALARAQQADDELAAGRDRGPLHGIPIGVKDNIAAACGPTTAQSLVLDPAWGSGKDATVVARANAGGAVIMGKTTTMEFALGMVDPAKPFPAPRNPWDRTRWAGGSSSGTGSGVATGLFLAGFSTDTAGSGRVPAAYCGVTGLVPTFGRVPKSGVVPLGYSLDRVGAMARSARDCGSVLAVVAGLEPSDPDSVDMPWTDVPAAFTGSLSGQRIGVVREGHFPDFADPALASTFDSAVSTLASLGADPVEIRLPYLSEMLIAEMVIMCSEAAAYHRPDLRTRWSDYFASSRSTLVTGALVSGADYVQAQRIRSVAQTALASLFADLDAIVTPTAATGAPRYDELIDDEGRTDVAAIFASIFTPYWNCVGNPVLVVPMGFGDGGMPLSLQIAGRPFAESEVLAIGDAYQQVTDWHLRVPPCGDPAIGATG